MDQRVLEILRDEIPGLGAESLATPFDRLDIDSFGLVTLRARIERAIGRELDDAHWTSSVTPEDLMRAVAETQAPQRPAVANSAGERRDYHLNMPQMALGGLSESWLFKELGDLHWSMITRGLRCPSSALTDGGGERLYATFTRIALALERPLPRYRENEAFSLDGGMARFGAGIFLSDVELGGGGRAEIMSSFSRRGEAGSNLSLLKGQPEIPSDCAIPALDRPPAFAEAYRARRAAAPPPALFECDYEIVPQHDINGVGLLYFAAYPVISDICDMRHRGRKTAFREGLRRRDVYYFGNCDPDETLVYRAHALREERGAIEIESSLSRKSDGAAIAYLVSGKARLDG